jgi:hypothetical protein
VGFAQTAASPLGGIAGDSKLCAQQGIISYLRGLESRISTTGYTDSTRGSYAPGWPRPKSNPRRRPNLTLFVLRAKQTGVPVFFWGAYLSTAGSLQRNLGPSCEPMSMKKRLRTRLARAVDLRDSGDILLRAYIGDYNLRFCRRVDVGGEGLELGCGLGVNAWLSAQWPPSPPTRSRGSYRLAAYWKYPTNIKRTVIRMWRLAAAYERASSPAAAIAVNVSENISRLTIGIDLLSSGRFIRGCYPASPCWYSISAAGT